jgi:hypothetical protein
MKKLIIALVLFYITIQCKGQITFQNPSFEGTSAGADTVPLSWRICEGSPNIAPIAVAPWLLPAHLGSFYIDMGIGGTIVTPDTLPESFGQQLSCNLIPNKSSHFSCYAYSVTYYHSYELSRLQVWGAHSLCSREQLLWESGDIDTLWTRYDVSFIPNEDFNFIVFRTEHTHTNELGSEMGIDDLSPISIDNYNFLSASFSDTIIKKYSCVTFAASSDDTTATYQWSSIPTGFNDTGKSVSTCPLINTQYFPGIAF